MAIGHQFLSKTMSDFGKKVWRSLGMYLNVHVTEMSYYGIYSCTGIREHKPEFSNFHMQFKQLPHKTVGLILIKFTGNEQLHTFIHIHINLCKLNECIKLLI